MTKVGYHGKTLLHRNQAQERLGFMRLLFKNDKRNDILTIAVVHYHTSVLECCIILIRIDTTLSKSI